MNRCRLGQVGVLVFVSGETTVSGFADLFWFLVGVNEMSSAYHIASVGLVAVARGPHFLEPHTMLQGLQHYYHAILLNILTYRT